MCNAYIGLVIRNYGKNIKNVFRNNENSNAVDSKWKLNENEKIKTANKKEEEEMTVTTSAIKWGTQRIEKRLEQKRTQAKTETLLE